MTVLILLKSISLLHIIFHFQVMVQLSWQNPEKLINQINQAARCLNIKYCKLDIVFDSYQNRLQWSNEKHAIYFSSLFWGLSLCYV